MASLEKPRLLDEVLDFLASHPSDEGILNFYASEPLVERSRYLLDKNRDNQLTPEEAVELDDFSRMNHFVIMLKARVRQKQMSAYPL